MFCTIFARSPNALSFSFVSLWGMVPCMDGMTMMKHTTTTLANTPPCAAAVATTMYHGTNSRWDTEQGTQKGKKEKDQIQECIQPQGNINSGNTGIFIRKVSETNDIQLMYSLCV
jgi:hypothetical protein